MRDRIWLVLICLIAASPVGAQGLGLGLGTDDVRAGGGTPTWVLNGNGVFASLDLDFQNSRYYQTGTQVSGSPANFVTVSRASSKNCDDTAGNWISVLSNALCVTNKGALIEEARTNSIGNNSMQGAVAGVVGSGGALPTNWLVAAVNGLTTTVIGTGVTKGIDYIDIQVSGTTSGTTYTIQIDNFVTTNGQSYVLSGWSALVGGTLTNISAVEWLQGSSGGVVGAANSSATLSRGVTAVYASTGATIQPDFRLTTTASAAVNATFRIGWPQYELGSFATSPIRTTAAAVARAADVVTATTAPAFGSAYTLFAKGTPNAPDTWPTANQSVITVSNGTTANRVGIFRNLGNAAVNSFMVSGGVGQTSPASAGTWGQTTSRKVAGAFAVNDSAVDFNAGAVSTSTANTMPVSPNRTDIGADGVGSGQWNGYVERVALWPTTRQPNATLQSLTQ